jgi:hypothetical protein
MEPEPEPADSEWAPMEDWSAEQAAQWAVGTLELPPDGAIAAQLHKEFEEEELDGRELLHKMRGTGKKLHKVLKGVVETDAAADATDATQRLLRASAGLREQAERALASPVSEARTPFSVRWGALLATDGPDRLHALQAAADGWQAGRWVLQERLLGQGGGGAVFESTDKHHAPARVAIKFVHTDDGGRATITREAALMQRVAHQHICKLYEHQVSGDGLLCGMVLELLDG